MAVLMKEHREQIWDKLEEHRRRAATCPLQILILGPSNDGSIEYKTRCKLRKKLTSLGHKAAFGEDLHKQSKALTNPIDDLTLQADAAHLIIMIYRSRGTQTERDVLLSNKNFADKSIVFLDATLFDQVSKSLSGEDWRLMSEVAEVIKYSKRELSKCVIKAVCNRTEELRKQVYARAIRYGGVL